MDESIRREERAVRAAVVSPGPKDADKVKSDPDLLKALAAAGYENPRINFVRTVVEDGTHICYLCNHDTKSYWILNVTAFGNKQYLVFCCIGKENCVFRAAVKSEEI